MHETNISAQKTDLIEQWKKMKEFGDWLMQHGISCATNRNKLEYEDRIFEQRVGVTLVHQSAEILMKSYLANKSVNIVTRKNRKGRDITMTFTESVKEINKIFLKNGLEQIDEGVFENFDEVRNEIYHRSFKIPWEKDEEIQKFLNEFERFYKTAFRKNLDTKSESVMNRFRKTHS